MLVGIGRDGRSREIASVSILNDETKSVVRFVPESALSAAQRERDEAIRSYDEAHDTFIEQIKARELAEYNLSVAESALSAAQRERDEARRANGVILGQLADEAATSYGRKTRIDELEAALSAAQAEMRERAARLADENIVGMEPDEIDDRNTIALAAAIRALPLTPTSERPAPWRSMDSAPMDGRELLVTNGTIIIVAFYDNRPAYARQPWAFVGGDHFPANWPTRWMPLPPLPASERDGGAA
jgi:DNA-binding transcriptional MerR regulator